MRHAIRFGWEKANEYRLMEECCVRSYLEFMCLLGSDFDSDTLLPWTEPILRDESRMDEVKRGDLLHETVWAYLRSIASDYAALSTGPIVAEKNIPLSTDEVSAFLQVLRRHVLAVFPAKCSYASDMALRNALSKTLQAAFRYGITTALGVTQFTVVGHLF